MSEIKPNIRKQWHVFSPELARKINPQQPDIAGAILLMNISTWLKNNYEQLNINGKRHCARSLSELAKDHPYFTKKAIEKIINRVETKGFLCVRRDRKKLHFYLNAEAVSLCAKKKGHIMFKIEDAVLYGEKAAVLLANLQWQSDNRLPHIIDFSGTAFYPLGPAKLSQHLPMSRWTIARTLEQLSTGMSAVLSEHPTDEHYYARVSVDSDASRPKSAREEVDTMVADVDCDVAEGDKIQMADSNKGCNQGEKWFSPPLSPASPAKATLVTSFLPEQDDQLIRLSDNQAELNMSNETPSFGNHRFIIVTDDDEYELDKDTLPKTEPERSRAIFKLHQEEVAFDTFPDFRVIEDTIAIEADKMAAAFCLQGCECTAADENTFKQLFFDNPEISAERLIEVFSTCRRLQEYPSRQGISIGSFIEVDRKTCLTFPRRVKSAKYFLHRLPEIIAQLFGTFEEADDDLRDINFKYLGEERVNDVVQLYQNGETAGTMRTEHICNPMGVN